MRECRSGCNMNTVLESGEFCIYKGDGPLSLATCHSWTLAFLPESSTVVIVQPRGVIVIVELTWTPVACVYLLDNGMTIGDRPGLFQQRDLCAPLRLPQYNSAIVPSHRGCSTLLVPHQPPPMHAPRRGRFTWNVGLEYLTSSITRRRNPAREDIQRS